MNSIRHIKFLLNYQTWLLFAGVNNPLYIFKRFENLKIDQFENVAKAETSDSSSFSNLQINKVEAG